MSTQRTVRVERNRLRFAAAHMATFGGGCEPLHGHNYDLIVEVEGDLSAEAWVIDFGLLKRLAREVCQSLDHRFLLQRESRIVQAEERDGAWLLHTPGEREYRFPSSDVVALAIDNSTAERLAEWIHARLSEQLRRHNQTALRLLSVGVEEMPGQAAWYRAPLTGVADA